MFGFTGLPFDSGSETYRTPTRPYDPLTGRWDQPDWINELGGQTNLYAYCGNSPTNATDPSGMATDPRDIAANAGDDILRALSDPKVQKLAKDKIKAQLYAQVFNRLYQTLASSTDPIFANNPGLRDQIKQQLDNAEKAWVDSVFAKILDKAKNGVPEGGGHGGQGQNVPNPKLTLSLTFGNTLPINLAILADAVKHGNGANIGKELSLNSLLVKGIQGATLKCTYGRLKFTLNMPNINEWRSTTGGFEYALGDGEHRTAKFRADVNLKGKASGWFIIEFHW